MGMMWGVFEAILCCVTGDVTIIMSFDPFGGEVEACSNGDFKVRESCVLDVSIRYLIVGFLVFSHSISKAPNLLAKFVFHLPVDGFTGFDGFEQAITNGA
jgi:hypothetical protein